MFYIGQMGGGLTVDTSTHCGYTVFGNFSTLAAQTALTNKEAVYGEWFMLGLRFYNSCAGANSQGEAYQWGVDEADAAVNAIAQFPEINRRTIFTDVESGSWSTNISLNQTVILGFLSQIINRGYYPGVYSSPCAWQEITASMPLPCGTVTWTGEFSYAEEPACPPQFVPQPNTACPSSYVGPHAFGGIMPNIWQYYESNTADWDIANALPDKTVLPGLYKMGRATTGFPHESALGPAGRADCSWADMRPIGDLGDGVQQCDPVFRTPRRIAGVDCPRIEKVPGKQISAAASWMQICPRE